MLAVLLLGIALLCRAYGVGAAEPGSAHYESVLSMLTRAVMGRGWFYYVTMGSVLLVLSLSANTAFADFPRLTRAIASNNYLPHVFLLRGRRLLYSWGIYVLVTLTAVLLIHFWRRNRPADSAVCDWRLSGFYALASRHGGALEKEG